MISGSGTLKKQQPFHHAKDFLKRQLSGAGCNQRSPMDVPPSVAPIAQIKPLSGFKGLSKLFSTHPPTEERVARLQAMAAAG